MKSTYVFNKATEVNPIDRKSIYIEVNYDNEAIINQSYPQVGIKNLRFGREDVSVFESYAKANGLFYAPYFDINLSKGNKTYNVPLYFDLTDGYNFSKDGVEPSVKLYQSLDWLNDVIDSFTFESIIETVESGDNITPTMQLAYNYILAHTIYIPYTISTIPNYIQSFTALLTCFSMAMMIEKEIDVLITIFGPNAGGFFTTIPAVAGLLIHIAYIILMGLALYNTFLNFIFSIIQPVKYHAAMLMSDLMIAACIFMGLDFKSSIFQTFPFNQIALLPEKYIPVANGSQNVWSIAGKGGALSVTNAVGGYIKPTPSEQQGYPIMTGGDLFRLAKKLCNGKILLQNPDTNPNVSVPTLVLERRDYVPNTPLYQLPDVRADWNGYNTKEFNATTILKFTKDLNDKNTFDQYQGEILSSVVQCANQPDPLCAITKGLREIQIDAARGIRKEKLTIPEDIMNGLSNILAGAGTIIQGFEQAVIDAVRGIITVWNDIIKVLHDLGIINSSTKNNLTLSQPNNATNPFGSLANAFAKRIGCLQMEHDLVNVPKILFLDFENMYSSYSGDWLNPSFSGYNCYPLHAMNSSIVNTLFLWNQFYCIDSWCPVGTYTVPTYSDTQGNGNSTPGFNYGTFNRPPGGDKGRHNQFTLWTPANSKSSDKNKVLLDFDDFNLLANNNTFNDMTGVPCIVDSLGWHYEEGWMDLSYRRNELYDNNLTNTITLPNGQ